MSLLNRYKTRLYGEGQNKDIPIIPQETIFSLPVSPDMNFLSQQYQQHKLKSYQKAFYDNVTDPKNAFYFIRVCFYLSYYSNLIVWVSINKCSLLTYKPKVFIVTYI